jgi:hypothetical protein
MAQSLTLLSGSPLIGCPIVLRAVPAGYNQNRTFHRLILHVLAALEGDEDYTTFDFSMPVEQRTSGGRTSNQAAQFDVSSALRAVAQRYEYTATPPTRYPYIKFRVEVWDEWMLDGVVYKEQGRCKWPAEDVTISGHTYTFYAYAFMGKFTDMERLQASGEDTQQLDVMTCKPTEGTEVVHQNCTIVYPVAFQRGLEFDHMSDDAEPVFVSGAPSNGPRSDQFTPQSTGAMVVGGRNVYVIPKPADAAELRFISSKGCMESLHLRCLPKRVVNIQTDKYVISRQETFKKFSRATTRKHADYETWTLSSGPLDEAWAEFYIHEVLMAQVMWLHRGQMWLPCHVLPEETTQLRDKSKPELIEVQLTVQMDVDGAV